MKIKVRHPKYTFVAADMSAAEVRTAANAAYLYTGMGKMIDAYRSYDYEKSFTSSIVLYSYERLKTKNGLKTLYILSTDDILLDEENNEVKIIKKEEEGDKEKLILGDSIKHTFKINKPGQDLYSLIASKAYNNKYEENLEFYPEGTKVMVEGKEIIAGDRTITHKAGKTRRQDSKAILIGLIYGRGVTSIMDQINESRSKKGQPLVTKEDTQNLIDGIYKAFPELKVWMDQTHDFVHKNGYIDDALGRRRRLPDGMLPHYTVEEIENDKNFNPFLECEDRKNTAKINYYKKELDKIKWKKDYDSLKEIAFKDGIRIEDNQGYIAQAERQAVNFQAQGMSSEINKLSMIIIDNHAKLNELGFELLLTIHDEVIGRCPVENAEEVAKIIPQIMINACKDQIKCPMKSDASIFQAWYEDDMNAAMNEHYNNLIKEGINSEEAIDKLIKEHTELPGKNIRNFLLGNIHSMWDNINEQI